MKKGKLVKSGKKGWKIESSEFKKGFMPIMGDFGFSGDMDGKEVEFDNSGGAVKLVHIDGKDFRKRESKPPMQKGNQSQPVNKENNFSSKKSNPNLARAPYNFVPLNEQVVPSNGKVDHSVFEGYSGYIDLILTIKQPLFLRGEGEYFFRNGNKPVIPGSSLRGLVSHLVNIVSYSKLQPDEHFENKTLYRRSNLTDDGDAFKAGFLRRKSNKSYEICKAEYIQIRDNQLKNKSFAYQFSSNGCIFSTGPFGKRGSTVWQFTSQNNADSIPLGKDVVKSYISDDLRAEEAPDIIKSLNKGVVVDRSEKSMGGRVSVPSFGFPVFYRTNKNGKVESFGHAKYHRVPYSKSIADHVIQKNTSDHDFTNSLFGNTGQATKVFFEDAYPHGEIRYECDEPRLPKILASPKPTSYQHYLEQPNGINTGQKQQKKWSDDDTPIRGFKNYWHRKSSSNSDHKHSWVESGQKSKSHPDPIQPISPGSKFKGRIRFENLTQEELGALLFVLDLPQGCCHKLGMGKPLGLGSVQIIPRLTIINRKDRYAKLFDTNGKWHLSETHEHEMRPFKDAFASYIGKNTNQNNVTGSETYWANNERMQALKEMLTFEHDTIDDWLDRTRYMEIQHSKNGNEFKNRPVLPKPSEVVQKNLYRKT